MPCDHAHDDEETLDGADPHDDAPEPDDEDFRARLSPRPRGAGGRSVSALRRVQRGRAETLHLARRG